MCLLLLQIPYEKIYVAKWPLSFFRNGIHIDKRTSESIWHPIIIFEDLMKKEDTKLYGDTSGETMEYFHNQNQLSYSESFIMKFSCAKQTTNFKSFPFDSHSCCWIYTTIRKF